MLQVGDVLVGRYEIEALLGEGGMGAVFRAFDTLKQRKVAVKEFRLGDLPSEADTQRQNDGTRIHPKTGPQLTREEALRQFSREAHLISPLSHRNLPEIYDLVILTSEAYMAMTLIDGRPLSDILEENGGPLPEATVTGWLLQVLDALAYCHGKNVIHRDLKPENLLLTPNGLVYLIDFGISKTLNPGQTATVTGARLLTPGYAPPEQYSLKGGTDPRSDLYSLGATTYYLLTGTVPAEATERMAGEKVAPPRSLNPIISERMETFILCCLEMDKEKRPASATAAANLLNPTQEPTAARQQPVAQIPQPAKPVSHQDTIQKPIMVSSFVPESIAIDLGLGVKMEFARVPAGKFLMGAGREEKNASTDERPQHLVFLDEYWIGKFPVTNAQYAVFVQAIRGKAPGHWFFGKMPKKLADHPVVNVSWLDANAFCQWASQKTRNTIRLPSEAEWEKAARSTDGRTWPWGNTDPNSNMANFGQNVGDTTKVGIYPQGVSPYGALDMAGNVWEWVADWYQSDYYATFPKDQWPDNPTGPESGTYRVLRGGSWSFNNGNLRTSYRVRINPDVRDSSIGFRCSRSSP